VLTAGRSGHVCVNQLGPSDAAALFQGLVFQGFCDKLSALFFVF